MKAGIHLTLDKKIIMKMIRLLLLLWIPAFAGMTVSAQAAEPGSITFLPSSELVKHEKTITKVEQYLSGLTTITSEFTQVAPDGSLVTGKFFLERPGRMRWQYNPPTPILMVGNGSDLVYYDYELQQITHIPMDSTLIGFLAQKKIRFDDDVGVISFSEDANIIRIGVAQRKKPEEGQLMLELSDKPLLIRNMVVTDASGKVTTVSLNNARFGTPIDKALFDFRDPRQPRKR